MTPRLLKSKFKNCLNFLWDYTLEPIVESRNKGTLISKLIMKKNYRTNFRNIQSSHYVKIGSQRTHHSPRAIVVLLIQNATQNYSD